MWCENSLEESRRVSKKFQKQSTEHCTVFSCTHKGALRERTVLQTEGKGGGDTVSGKDK